MPPRTPSYRHHKPSDRAVVTLHGKDRYLGRYGTAASREQYDRLIAEWLANGRRPVIQAHADLTVVEVVAAFWCHAETYYRKPDGSPTSEVAVYRATLKPLTRLYGTARAVDFGPKALKVVRDEMIRLGWSRKSINKQVGRLRTVFKWAAEQELVSATVYHALQAVAGLKCGRSNATESEPVRPVPEAHIQAIRPHVSAQVWALVQLQLLTAARPGELLVMRPVDLKTGNDVWTYVPASHKTLHHGYIRTIYLGPKAQEIIAPFLAGRPVDAYLFSPIEAEAARRATQREQRRSPVTPSQVQRGELAKTRRRRRPIGPFYKRDEYRRAILRGCQKADRAAHAADPEIPADREVVPRWHPHQLRHNAATNIRREFGIEMARAILGHRSVGVTEIYAEQDEGKAQDVIRRIG